MSEDEQSEDGELRDMVSSLTGSKEAMAALGSAVADALKTQGLPAGQTSSGSFGGGQPTAAMFGHQQPANHRCFIEREAGNLVSREFN